MLDIHARRLIDPPLDRWGRTLAATGVSANAITLLGLGLGLVAALAVALNAHMAALVLIGLNRLADGLDGAVARVHGKTDFGGYLDITCDFLFYGAIPIGFVWGAPDTAAHAGAWLLGSFYFNGATFLGYAILAERHAMQTAGRGAKSLYFTGGLLEGTETIAFFCCICLFPVHFAPLAWIFGGLCFITAVSRIMLAHQVFVSGCSRAQNHDPTHHT